MRCFKHGGSVPCKICMQEEFDRCYKENWSLEHNGQKPKHDLTALKEALDKL